MLPKRMVLVQMNNNCMFCPDPLGKSFIYDVGHLLGYITCEKCKDICKQKADEFTNSIEYGRARHLKNKDLKIKRSNNTIEEGWKLHYPIIRIVEGIEFVQCNHFENQLEKWCRIDTIIELNNDF